ncbi:MAG: hypothetical protein ACRD1C_07750 [Terriglobales bacterium]
MRAADGQIFAITGLCRRFDFRPGNAAFCLVHLGSAELDDGDNPYLLARRSLEGGTVTAIARIEWEGVFTVLADDDAAAEALFHDLVVPAEPEEVQRQWTGEAATVELFRAWRMLK